MPVARYNAYEFTWHLWEPPVVSVCEVVPVAAIVHVFSSIVHILGPILYYNKKCPRPKHLANLREAVSPGPPGPGGRRTPWALQWTAGPDQRRLLPKTPPDTVQQNTQVQRNRESNTRDKKKKQINKLSEINKTRKTTTETSVSGLISRKQANWHTTLFIVCSQAK